LEKEARAVGFEGASAVGAEAVELEGDLADAMRLNLWSRVAGRVLFEVAAFEARTPDELYEGVAELPWEDWLRVDRPMHWRGSARGVECDVRYALLRCKDAVADRFMARRGRRPNATPDPEGAACMALRWEEGGATVFLDTSGVPLSKRGYRADPWTAPVRETLAAAVLLEAGWEPGGGEAVVSPMCGSGTFAIEAAWMAQRRAPGLGRKFSFLNYEDAPLGVWRAMEEEARAAFRAVPGGWFAATDRDPGAVTCASRNAVRAGVDKLVRLQVCDFRETALPRPPALVVMNPEYGERLGDAEALGETYRAIGDWLKGSCAGMRAAVLSGNPELTRKISLKPSRRLPVWNGPLECRALFYDLYEGTRDRRLLRKHGGR
jgi:putative N6-adenine-specific DNA methylase